MTAQQIIEDFGRVCDAQRYVASEIDDRLQAIYDTKPTIQNGGMLGGLEVMARMMSGPSRQDHISKAAGYLIASREWQHNVGLHLNGIGVGYSAKDSEQFGRLALEKAQEHRRLAANTAQLRRA